MNEGLPDKISEEKWDVILVDAPEGWQKTSPGRMKSIYFASQLAHAETDIFVHDCNREVERAYCDKLFDKETLCHQVGRLRHYCQRPKLLF